MLRRVRVKIGVWGDYRRIAPGCGAKLEGQTGTVIAEQDGMFMVRFDASFASWWNETQTVKTFWFPASDLAPAECCTGTMPATAGNVCYDHLFEGSARVCEVCS